MEIIIGVTFLILIVGVIASRGDNSGIERYYRTEYKDEYNRRDKNHKDWWLHLHN